MSGASLLHADACRGGAGRIVAMRLEASLLNAQLIRVSGATAAQRAPTKQSSRTALHTAALSTLRLPISDSSPCRAVRIPVGNSGRGPWESQSHSDSAAAQRSEGRREGKGREPQPRRSGRTDDEAHRSASPPLQRWRAMRCGCRRDMHAHTRTRVDAHSIALPPRCCLRCRCRAILNKRKNAHWKKQANTQYAGVSYNKAVGRVGD